MPSTNTTVIVSSYNQPRALALVFRGLAGQTRPIEKIIVADDGSTKDTFNVIDWAVDELGLPISPVITQPDDGFRKTRAINRAVMRCQTNRLLFLDGDVVPLANWHHEHARVTYPFTYVVGDFVRTDRVTSEQLYERRQHTILQSQLESAVIAFARKRSLRRRQAKARFYTWFRNVKRPKLLGGNFSVDRALFEAVNGFDETFIGFSAMDSDIRNRMNRRGGRPIERIRETIGVHLSQRLDRPYTNKNRLNYADSKHLLQRDCYWAERGLSQHRTESL